MELLLYNGILSLPVLLVIISVTGEVWDSAQSLTRQSQESLAFLPLLVASLLMGSLLNYCLFLCTLCNSALTTTIVGTLRSVLGTVSSHAQFLPLSSWGLVLHLWISIFFIVCCVFLEISDVVNRGLTLSINCCVFRWWGSSYLEEWKAQFSSFWV